MEGLGDIAVVSRYAGARIVRIAGWLANALDAKLHVLTSHEDEAARLGAETLTRYVFSPPGPRVTLPILMRHETLVREAEAVFDAASSASLPAPGLVLAESGLGASFLLKHLWPESLHATLFGGFPRILVDRTQGQAAAPQGKVRERLASRVDTAFPLLEMLHCDAAFVFGNAQFRLLPPDWAHKAAVLPEPVFLAQGSEREAAEAAVQRALSALPRKACLVSVSGTTRHERFGQIIARPLAQLHARMTEHALQPAFLLLGAEPGRDALAAKLRAGGLPVAHLPAVSGAIRQAVFRRSALHLAYCEPDCEEPRLAEAMTCGCLVAASDTPYPRTLIRHRRYGLLLPFGSPEAAAEECLGALSGDDAFAAIAAAGRDSVLARQAPDLCLPDYLRFLDGIRPNYAFLDPLAAPSAA